MNGPKTHPVMTSPPRARDRERNARVPAVVTERAYEVYADMYGKTRSLEHICCERGGFTAGELIALLYARSFPKEEWRDREHEAVIGMDAI